MNLQDLQAASAAANDFIEHHGSMGLSDETILMLCYMERLMAAAPAQAAPRSQLLSAIAAGSPPPAISAVPGWFAEGIKQFAGSRVTAKQVMGALGQPTDIGSLRNAGAWLRSLYGEPTRSNGYTLFKIPGVPASRPAVEDDPEDPFAPSIPLSSRVITFALTHPGERFTPDAIAHQLGCKGTKEECTTIGITLTREGFAPDQDGVFTLSKLR